jgi:hypothetical protein
MANQAFFGLMSHPTSQACVVDLTPPTFSGVTSATPNSDGSFTVAYSAATDTALPVTYEIYILPGVVSAATLFAASPCDNPRVVSRRTYIDSNGAPMVKDQTYTVGVRVRDAANNLNTNTAVITATAIGSVNLAQIYQDLQTSFALDHTNFVTDHTNFLSDHADFVTDHANFVADDAAFDADHAAFQVDHADFQDDHDNFEADHVNFLSDHANFVEDHANLSETAEDLDSNVVRLTASDLAGSIIDEEEVTATLTEEDEL